MRVMLKNYTPRQRCEMVGRSLDFTDQYGNGFSFDCDENGNPEFETAAARRSYEYAMDHPEMFPAKFNEVVTRRWSYMQPAHGTCRCGENVQLTDDYMGACKCEKCGQWYNMYGDELIDPEYWEEAE